MTTRTKQADVYECRSNWINRTIRSNAKKKKRNTKINKKMRKHLVAHTHTALTCDVAMRMANGKRQRHKTKQNNCTSRCASVCPLPLSESFVWTTISVWSLFFCTWHSPTHAHSHTNSRTSTRHAKGKIEAHTEEFRNWKMKLKTSLHRSQV